LTRKRHLSAECVDTVKEYSFCKATLASAILASNVRHNVTLSRRQCASIMNLEHLKFAFNEVLDSDSPSWTAPEQMYEMFKKKNILFGMLYHCKAAIESELPGYEARRRKRKKDARQTGTVDQNNIENIPVDPSNIENVPPSLTTVNRCEDNVDTPPAVSTVDGILSDKDDGVCIFETFFPESTESISTPKIIEDSDPVEFANDCRMAYETQDDQDMVLALIWSMPHCRQLFHAFPEVLFIDGTHKTNNEKYPLLTVGIRDENFKMNIILRAFCPNERSWMFQWLFKEAIPAVLGVDACRKRH
jgi:MULE transposase domain